ncbi:MAG: hypothetical protein ACI9H6_000318 [Patiriisocius sp.]|jgi:hypothetical protein
MTSVQTKRLLLIAGLLTFSVCVFMFTDIGNQMASVITGTDSRVSQCIQALPESKRDTPYDSISTRLNTDSHKDIILKASGEAYCGSAGCAYELCVVKNSVVTNIPFGYAAEELQVSNTLTNGMYDIQLLGKSNTNFQWDGTHYAVGLQK